MKMLTTLLLVVSVNLDSMGVGFAYGTRKIHLPLSSNLIIALIACGSTVGMMMIGKYLKTGRTTTTLASYLGCGIIITIGIWSILIDLRKPTEGHGKRGDMFSRLLQQSFRADANFFGNIEAGEAVILGVVLALNNLACGFGAGLIGMNPLVTAVLVFVMSMFLFSVGIRLGGRLTSRWSGDRTGLLAGLILVMIGFCQLFFEKK